MGTPNSSYNLTEDADEQLLQGKAKILNLSLAFTHSFALKSAVELRIADIIHSHGKPMSLSQIASNIDSTTTSSLNLTNLERLMQVLVWNNIFSINYNDNNNNQSTNELDQDDIVLPLYGLTPTSRWLIHDYEFSLAPVVLNFRHPLFMPPWHELSHSIKTGGTAFEKAYGETYWEKGSKDPEFNKLVNTSMMALTNTVMDAILRGYKEGFSELKGTLVDVGGGTGLGLAKIVGVHAHIKGVNFDRPHVVATAPQYDGVTHVGGDMFQEIPCADNIFIKSILHDWGDEDCLKILKNCQTAVAKSKGKVIIVDIVLQHENKGLFDQTKLGCDLAMMAYFGGGKERTQREWNKLLKAAGFAHYNIIAIPSFQCIIEAFLQ